MNTWILEVSYVQQLSECALCIDSDKCILYETDREPGEKEGGGKTKIEETQERCTSFREISSQVHERDFLLDLDLTKLR